MYQTIISSQTLAAQIDDPDWVVFDCRFDIMQPEAGYQAFVKEHIPGAQYISLNDDMSSPPDSQSGRHPLPKPEKLCKKLEACGASRSSQIVVYDEGSNAISARLWWLLRWLGHPAVAVLDGGLERWRAEGLPLTDVVETATPGDFSAEANDNAWISVEQVESLLNHPDACIIDARAKQRFSGENETVDAVGGHIPGSVNCPFADNLDENNCFLPAEVLRQRFEELKKPYTIHSCGSGVTACHNLLAMEIAGLSGSKLYVGSWSEWIRSAERPIATGEN